MNLNLNPKLGLHNLNRILPSEQDASVLLFQGAEIKERKQEV